VVTPKVSRKVKFRIYRYSCGAMVVRRNRREGINDEVYDQIDEGKEGRS